jgi:Ca-activated chloride channel family protein
VRHAADGFTNDLKDHKAIILISDGGETDDSYALEATRKAFEERGIRVFTVGFGDMAEGARVPITQGGRRTYMEYQGQEVRTKLEPALLRAMAAAADAAYFPNPDFRVVYDRVRSKVTRREFRTTRREMRYARFHWFASVALVLLTIETVMRDRKAVLA